ncbi:hypothetical protein [Streptomyces sp. LaPpAH-108]|uniref:hypothetical protein n=1 Tax=Streptomyces sp. LaPpAH-108 TaxID=1155714 RepID=UPI00037FE5F1|nr:hypothetical protein [Streptomyces sp. LaPpAH-108]
MHPHARRQFVDIARHKAVFDKLVELDAPCFALKTDRAPFDDPDAAMAVKLLVDRERLVVVNRPPESHFTDVLSKGTVTNRTLAGLLRQGGVFLDADHMYDESAPRLDAAMSALLSRRRERQRSEGALDWADW